MHPALQGALIGAGIGAFLVLAEYVLLTKAAKDRAARLNRVAELDGVERNRIRSMVRFALLLPAGFALAFWFVWG
jgi:hypothetical protein